MDVMTFFFSSLLSFFHFGLLLIHVLTITRKPFLMVTKLTSRTPHMVLFLVHVISVISVFTAVTTNTRPQRVFSFVQTCVLVDVNQSLPWFFTRWPREDSFSVSWALGRICRRFSRFCNVLLQDLTLLHDKITRRKNLLSVSRRKLKLSTYLHTVSYNHISFLKSRNPESGTGAGT